ncbi:MAG: head GIN domain-containing protein, partial [Chitinophagales bacterium]
YLGLRFLGGRRFRIPVFSKSMILVFFITLISIIALSAYTATCFSSSSSGSKKVMLQLPESQRIHLEGQKLAPAGKPVVYFFNRDEYIVDEDMLWLGDKVKLDVLQSPDETAFLEIITKAKGSSRGQAFDRQESIQFNISMQDSVLRIPAHFPIEDPEKLRGQEVQLHLRLPLGAQVYLAESSKSVIYDIKNVTNTYDGNMIGYTWEMRPAGLTCIDCNGVALNRQQNFSMEELILNEDFTEVEANGSLDIHISEGPFLLQSDGENEIEYSVKNNRLQIENKKQTGFFDRQTKINLQMPELSELELNSVADASIKGFENSKMDMRISGANNCRIDIQVEELNLEINGAAKVNLEGESEKFYLEINGASKLNGTAFRTENAKVKIAGASKVDVWVTDKLDAKVSGASSLNYKGLPEIVSDVSGFSSIKPIQ